MILRIGEELPARVGWAVVDRVLDLERQRTAATRAGRFEAAWQRAVRRGGDRPQIEDYLAQGPPVRREKLFGELLEIELALRQQQGETVAAEEYDRRR